MDQYEGLWRKLEGIQMTKIGQNGAQQNVEPKYPIEKSKLSMKHLIPCGLLQSVFLHLINHQSQQVCNPSSLAFTWRYPFLGQKYG